MIAKDIKQYCSDDITTIENYEKAIKDSHSWELHHKYELVDKNGIALEIPMTRKELISLNLYYNRPACELIFLSETEHKRIHMIGNTKAKGKNLGNQHAKGNVLSEDVRSRMSKSRLGNYNNGFALIRCIETNETLRTREWILKGYQNAYSVAKGRQKTCKGLHFEYVREETHEYR